MKVSCKILILFFTILAPSVCLQAQEFYEVISSGKLNIRQSGSTDAVIIGTCSQGDVLPVYRISDGWAEIRHDNLHGYVSARYIQPYAPLQVSPSATDRIIDFWNKVRHLLSFEDLRKTLFWITVALIAILALCHHASEKNGNELLRNPSILYGIGTLLVITCVSECLYFLSANGDALWFCMPGEVGWFLTIINFVLFGLAVYKQIMCYLSLLQAANYHGCRPDATFYIGLRSVPIGIVVLLVCLWIFEDKVPYAIGGFLALQGLQIGRLIYLSIKNRSGVGNTLFSLLLFLVGMIGCLILLLHFIGLLIVVLIVYILLKAFCHSTDACCANCRTYSNGYCHYRQEYVSSGGRCDQHER